MSEWNDIPCKFRAELEDDRLDMKEKHDRLCAEINRYEGDDRLEKFQKLLSKKRQCVSYINQATTKIKELKELDSDEATRKELDKEFERINKMIEKFEELPDFDMSTGQTVEEHAEAYFNKLVEESEALDKLEDDEKKLMGPEWEVEHKKTEDSKLIDDLLEGLGL